MILFLLVEILIVVTIGILSDMLTDFKCRGGGWKF